MVIHLDNSCLNDLLTYVALLGVNSHNPLPKKWQYPLHVYEPLTFILKRVIYVTYTSLYLLRKIYQIEWFMHYVMLMSKDYVRHKHGAS